MYEAVIEGAMSPASEAGTPPTSLAPSSFVEGSKLGLGVLSHSPASSSVSSILVTLVDVPAVL